MPVSVSAKAITFINGVANDATQVDSEHTSLFNNDSALATKTNTLLLGNLEDSTNLTVNSLYAGSSPSNMAFRFNLGTGGYRGIRWNTVTTQLEFTNDGTTYNPISTLNPANLATSIPKTLDCAVPVYASSSTFTVANFSLTDSTGAIFLSKSGSTTVSTGTLGAAGIAQTAAITSSLTGTVGTGGVSSTTITGSSTTFTSTFVVGDVLWTASGFGTITAIASDTSLTVNTALTISNGTTYYRGILAGTVSTSGSSTTVTGSGTSFTSVFQVGDVLWTASGAAKITAIGSNTNLTVATALTLSGGTAYARGGLAINTFYYLYVVGNGTTSVLVISTRNLANGSDTFVDFPRGYTYIRQLSFALRIDGSGNIIPFVVAEGWPNGPLMLYAINIGDDGNGGGVSQVIAVGPTGNVTIDCSAFIPPISTLGYFKAALATGSGSSFGYWGSGSTDYQGITAQAGSSVNSFLFYMPTTSSQTIYVRLTATRMSGWVAGYLVTGVN